MNIKQHQTFKFENDRNGYTYFGHSFFQIPISHLRFFLQNCYAYVYRYDGPNQFITNLGKYGMQFNDLDITIDTKNNLIYISQLFFAPNYLDIMNEEEFYIKTESMNSVEVYQQNLLTSAIITKDNFLYLLVQWGQFLDMKYPFILFYLNDKNEYDLLPFDTQETMDQFIIAHTK